ncbi:ankyrin repeat domain-containing protein [Wolbachia endosymbiont of Folsomia candida]|uniref:ankyrin repeat domain-containing protein n=1 Tax=Wolbachia endosymbiont of Folsomia candida TaxID=169402 RepID=UPI000A5BC99D|nr:ankyrin repeat domain-containing protein [Wolbachia endosymbiont of Folsomia candida]APR98432.1 hypothetical protein ASM33_04090 [Wolbachia endosymbiont of Folsomia candida]
MTIDISTLTARAGELHKCVSQNEKREQDIKDKLLHDTIKAKVTKKKHNPLRNPFKMDGTITKCIALLRDGANPSKLELPEKDLKVLPIAQRQYYYNFIERLHKEIEKITLKIVNKEKKAPLQSEKTHCNAIRKRSESNDSAYGSDGSDIESDSLTNESEYSTDDAIPLISKPHSEQSSQEEKSKEKTPKPKKKFRGLNVRRTGRKFEPLNKSGKAGISNKINSIRQSIGQLLVRKNTQILQPDTNPYHNLDSKDNENNSTAVSGNVKIQTSTEIKDDSNCLLEAIKNGDQEQFKDHLESGEDITIQDEEGNNILHLIASLKKKQKCEFLDELVKCKKIPQENLAQLISCQNKDGKTPLQIALIAKIEKENHQYDKPRDSDNTLKFLSRLLELGANPNQLELPEESLKNLPKTKKDYHRHFLKKLTELVKNPQLTEDTTNKVIIKVAQIIDSDGYPLHSAVRDGNKNQFNKLLQRGCNITTQDAEGNTVLHYALKLKKGLRLNFTRFILEKNKELLNTQNNDGLTPIYILLEQIKKKNEDRSCTDRQFEKTGRYQILKLLIQSSADITAQDNKGNNVLHNIALLKEEQKVTCLELVLNSVKQEELNNAFNATNQKGQTPLQVVLIAKITKDNHKWISPKSRDNTIKFCVKLLQNGVDQKQFTLHERLWNREYYKTIKGIEKLIGKSLISDDMRTELKCNFGKKFKARDIMKYLNNVVYKVVVTLVFAVSISAVIFSASQGSIAIEIALPIIAAIGICYLICLNVENIYKGFGKIKEKFTAKEEVTPQDNIITDNTDLMQHNNFDENIENKHENQAAQELHDQPECAEKPSTQMDNIFVRAKSGLNHLLGCVGIQGSSGHNR